MKSVDFIEEFLTHKLVSLLQSIPEDRKPDWGTMSVWQMIEHLALPFKASNGNLQMPLTTPADKIDRVKQIGLMNDRPLQRNFNNPIFTDAFKVRRNNSIENSLKELQRDVDLFIDLFKGEDSGFTQTHNIFGNLNYEEWLQFHYKHVKHHLEQFGVVISD